MNIHIQDPKVSLENFDFIVAPEHDGLNGKNVLKSKGAIHYLRANELNENINYLKPQMNKEKIVTLIVGGPNKYYDYNLSIIEGIFKKVSKNFINDGYQLIFIPSMRTPKRVIDLAKNYFDNNQVIITEVDKKAYLSSLKLSDYIVVMCDSTSMISEAAMTGKPIYVAQMKPSKNNLRFQKFFSQFKQLNIIKDLTDKIDLWSYSKLDEVNRISPLINEKMKKNGII